MQNASQLKCQDVPSLSFVKMASDEVRMLSKIEFTRSAAYLLFDWAIVAGAIALSLCFPFWTVYVASVIMIGTRQHAFLVISHEGAHHRLSDKRWLNDIISNACAAFPIFFCTAGYRANHLVHHRHLNTDQDPDWNRKIPFREWQFPQDSQSLIWTFGKVLLTSWYKMILLFWALSGIGRSETWTNPYSRRQIFFKLGFYATVAAVLTLTHTWMPFVQYWLVPYFFVFPIVERIRSIAEHFGLERSHELNQTRNVLCTRAEGFFFGPHNVRYHLAHHMFPTVPQYNLPKLHSHLLKYPDYANYAHQNGSYLFGSRAVLRDILIK
jgi:fatty acid desaturase